MSGRLRRLDGPRRHLARLAKRCRADLARAAVRARASTGYAPQDVKFVVGEPRSGTTWLAEAVAGALGAPLVFEPDHARHDRDRSRRYRGFDAEMAALYQQVLTGRRLPAHSVQGGWALHSQQLVVKSVRAVPYLPALAKQFPAVCKTLIVRHPCAVVESRLRLGVFDPGKIEEIVPAALLDKHRHLAHPMSMAKNAAGTQALRWAVNHWSMAHTGEPRWHTVAYEALVDGDDHAARALAGVVGCAPSALGPLLARTSSTVWGGATVSAIDSWRTRLDPVDIRLILAIVHAVGIDWYDEDTKPVRPLPSRPLHP